MDWLALLLRLGNVALVAPIERLVQVASPIVVLLGLLGRWILLSRAAQTDDVERLPRGKVCRADVTAARVAGEVTPGLRAAWADPAIALARRYQLSAVVVIVALMVFKPS